MTFLFKRFREFWLVTAVSAVFIGGCAVGPNYKRPAVDSPSNFRGDNATTNSSVGDLAWWEIYQDKFLQALIREAFTNNYDLRIAATRVEQSRQLAAQARSQFFPSVGYDGVVGQGKNALFGSAYPNSGATGGSASVVANAFWEVDLWGRVRRLNESARAQFLATDEARRGVRLSLLSDVASDYLRLLELDEETRIAVDTTNSFGESLKIFNDRLIGGTASELETSRAQAALADAAASLPSIRYEVAEIENELSILLGRIPGPIERGGPLAVTLPPEIPAGLPSALLERRPDIRQSEQLLRSANAQIGQSIANFFPVIGLTGFLGRISPELSAFSLGTANAWGVAAEATGPIFEGGKLVAQYRQTKAARDEARLRYRQSVLVALRDVANALIAREQLAEIEQQQTVEVSSLALAVRVSTKRYLAGKASYYEVLEAQQQLFPAQLNLVRNRRDESLAVVDLYEALGGGWQDELKSTNSTAKIEVPHPDGKVAQANMRPRSDHP